MYLRINGQTSSRIIRRRVSVSLIPFILSRAATAHTTTTSCLYMSLVNVFPRKGTSARFTKRRQEEGFPFVLVVRETEGKGRGNAWRSHVHRFVDVFRRDVNPVENDSISTLHGGMSKICTERDLWKYFDKNILVLTHFALNVIIDVASKFPHVIHY